MVIKKYFQLWLKLTIISFQQVLSNRFSALLFFIGKFLRFILFFVFIVSLFQKTQFLASYTVAQVAFFFLTFNILDTVTQLFYREVYRFRPMVVSGDFDLVLVKPISPLFRALAGGADPLDLFMMIPYIGALIYIGSLLHVTSMLSIFSYVLLLFNGFLLATGFHILVLALAIVTTEIDHAIMIYRDLTSMGRVPVDIYHEPLRSIITFVIPVGIMMTYPAKAFLGLLTAPLIILSLTVSVAFIAICFKVWRYALSKYSSASS
ncbi:ABC-2 family transporter protein [Candidatus Gottesmanbacteria bacterium]|nr:ABC-2 family transporter protein [Candidatus Gottesmanbacteria bacterium]